MREGTFAKFEQAVPKESEGYSVMSDASENRRRFGFTVPFRQYTLRKGRGIRCNDESLPEPELKMP